MQTSLYDRLGGKSAIVAVVDEFVGRSAGDDRINAKFGRTDVPRLKAMLVDQVCAASGGPCTYTGRDMAATHAGMGVTAGEFDALVGNLVSTLDQFNVARCALTSWRSSPPRPEPRCRLGIRRLRPSRRRSIVAHVCAERTSCAQRTSILACVPLIGGAGSRASSGAPPHVVQQRVGCRPTA